MMFSIDVEDCCGSWELVQVQPLAEGYTRSRVRCSRCGHTRILTVSSIRARNGHLEVVA